MVRAIEFYLHYSLSVMEHSSYQNNVLKTSTSTQDPFFVDFVALKV